MGFNSAFKGLMGVFHGEVMQTVLYDAWLPTSFSKCVCVCVCVCVCLCVFQRARARVCVCRTSLYLCISQGSEGLFLLLRRNGEYSQVVCLRLTWGVSKRMPFSYPPNQPTYRRLRCLRSRTMLASLPYLPILLPRFHQLLSLSFLEFPPQASWPPLTSL